MENHCFKNWKLYVWFFCVTCNHSHLVVGREKVKWASLSGLLIYMINFEGYELGEYARATDFVLWLIKISI